MSNLFLQLAERKGLKPSQLEDWSLSARGSAIATLAMRLLRGAFLKFRLQRSDGILLRDRGARIHHPGYISVGDGFSIEEGVEIVGVSKRGLVFGSRCSVKRHAIIHPSNLLIGEPGEGLQVGDRSNIGAFSFIGCSGYISIGTDVMMGPRVTLLAETHVHDQVDIPMKNQGVRRSFITIEDDCWIGACSTILPGVTVGKGCVIAAGAVVTRDVPPYSIAAGVPARIVKHRE